MQQYIPFSLGGTSSLQIKTNAKLGSNEEIFVQFYEGSDNTAKVGGGFRVVLTDPPKHFVKDCEKDLVEFQTPLPAQDGDDRLWTIVKRDTSLSIIMNGVEVRNLTFKDSTFRTDRCPRVYGRSLLGIEFLNRSVAARSYREQPTGTSYLHFSTVQTTFCCSIFFVQFSIASWLQQKAQKVETSYKLLNQNLVPTLYEYIFSL